MWEENFVNTLKKNCPADIYREVPKVRTVVTFGFSRLFLSLLSEGRYFRNFTLGFYDYHLEHAFSFFYCLEVTKATRDKWQFGFLDQLSQNQIGWTVTDSHPCNPALCLQTTTFILYIIFYPIKLLQHENKVGEMLLFQRDSKKWPYNCSSVTSWSRGGYCYPLDNS